jgi:hypothetical protein
MAGREPVIEDVHQSPGALLPARPGGYMGNADQRPKQIEGVEISSYIATLDCAFGQRINRRLDQAAETS